MPKKTFFNLSSDKKNRIIDAAIDEFADKTFHRAKITNIIENADISPGSFYKYFEDKRDLYKYLLSLLAQKKMDYINQDLMLNTEEYNFFYLLKELYQSGLKFARENPRLLLISNKLINEDSELYREIIGDNKVRSEEFFYKIIEEGVNSGEIRSDIDLKLLSKILSSMFIAMAEYIYKEKMLYFNDMSVIDNIIDIIKNGIKNNNTFYEEGKK